jgi:hypothetical protein
VPGDENFIENGPPPEDFTGDEEDGTTAASSSSGVDNSGKGELGGVKGGPPQ